MSEIVIYDDDAIFLSLPGSVMGGLVWDVHPTIASPPFHVLARIIVTPAPATYPVFKLPDLYNYYPEIVRWMDKTYVSRNDIPLYYWDSVPRWDAEPFTWDEVIGPEPILKTTTRIMQLELEKSAQEISDLLTIYNLDRCQYEFLPYHAALMGTPLPAAKEAEQRSFLEELGATYRSKGTPLSFFRLFESLGFTLTLQENYHRKSDAFILPGPQIDMVSTNHVTGEFLTTTSALTATYDFEIFKTPVQRGGVTIKVYSPSANTPTEITDDGAGGWTAGYGGGIDYLTGSCTLILPSIPALPGQPIEVDYYYLVDAFPDPHETHWTNRWRSSVVYFALTPIDNSINLTPELNDRLRLYLELLKPAHIVIDNLIIVFSYSDSEYTNELDTLDMFSRLHVESLFGTLYLGYGWAAQNNGSVNNNPVYYPQQGRLGNEFLTEWSGPATPVSLPGHLAGQIPLAIATYKATAPLNPDVGDFWIDTSAAPTTFALKMYQGSSWVTLDADLDDPTRYPNIPPYTYPFKMDGLFTQPTSGNDFEADWFNVAPATDVRFDSLITNDIPVPLVTQFSIDEDVGTTLGVGDTIVLVDGPDGGETSVITTFTDNGTWYDVIINPALPTAPVIGNTVTILLLGSNPPLKAVHMDNLSYANRVQDPLDIYFTEVLAPAPDGMSLGPFGVTIIAAHRPIAAGSTSFLRFTIGAVDYEETATATGAFTNVGGQINVSNIDYATGIVSVTFAGGSPPDALTTVVVSSTIASAYQVGVC